MIHKKMNYAGVENVTIADFGNGTISVNNGYNDVEGYEALLMKTIDYIPIGEVSGNSRNSDEFSPEIVLIFRNKKSFDVFFEKVTKIKEEFEREKSVV